MAAPYGPFAAGPCEVRVEPLELVDRVRDHRLPCDLWSPVTHPPDAAGPARLVLFSHLSGGGRRSASYLCRHLAGHGYLVAALDHSEVAVAELQPAPGEAPEVTAARIGAVVANRVPDLRLALDRLLDGRIPAGSLRPDPTRIGLVGHSFGGWTVLAAAEVDPRVRAVVALAPAGSSRPRPGILPVRLSFGRVREVATLLLSGAEDVMTPLEGVAEIYGRCPPPKRMFVLRGADHLHFLDDAETAHESLRAAELPGESAWIPGAMQPFAELCPAEEAHDFARGLALAHLDAVLRDDPAANEFLGHRAVEGLRERGIDAYDQPDDG